MSHGNPIADPSHTEQKRIPSCCVNPLFHPPFQFSHGEVAWDEICIRAANTYERFGKLARRQSCGIEESPCGCSLDAFFDFIAFDHDVCLNKKMHVETV
jgi:hypothetical protein